MIDLHTHTTFSDGTDTPTQLINKALAAGITTIALTDHDSISGWQEATTALRPGICLVPGAEVSCQTLDGISVHILGLLFDSSNTELIETLEKTRENRFGRMEKIIAKINEAGIDISMSEVLEQLSDGATLGRPHLADALIKKGVVTNRKKTFHPGKTVASFCVGSKALYDFVHCNPHMGFYPSEYVNSPANIARNDKMVSINSAIEVDLTGQIVSDSIGHIFYSGIGGQVDFSRGASMSNGGKPIIALPSTAKNGTVSRIVAHLSEGGGVVTSRGHVHYVVTEFGVASLRGKSIRERALELIRVAHPKFRQQLLEQIRQHFWVPHYQLHTPTEVPELGSVGFKELNIDGEEFDLRPLNPSDERRLQEFFYSHTKETLQLRYSAVPTQMSREKSCTLVGVDQSKDLALCIVKQKGSAVQIQAVGRYYLLHDGAGCEVAFVTREKYQGKGMAKRLLQELIMIAEQRGLQSMVAFVRAENKAMLAVFQKAGFGRLPGDDPTEVYLQLRLPRKANSGESS